EAQELAETATVLRAQEDEDEENDEDEEESDEDDEDEELEQGLQSSSDKARKFEELHKHSSSFVDSEAMRALELERLLEETKVSAKKWKTRKFQLRRSYSPQRQRSKLWKKLWQSLTII
ncbi:hypothetical protein Droror1_Dr00026994, partial [Drosera rotundifolia]